jgi:hypothetical protein
MVKFLIIVMVAWLSIGACAAFVTACPLVTESQSHHDCCPRHTTASLTSCPYFVATKVATVSAAPPLKSAPLPTLAVPSCFKAVFHSVVQDQHDLHIAIRVMRV